jgi:hypothetical protein
MTVLFYRKGAWIGGRFAQVLQRYPYILCHFVLTPQLGGATIRLNIARLGRSAFRSLNWRWKPPLGEELCSICPALPSSASMRSATFAAIGFVRMPPVPSAMTAGVRAAGTCCATCRRRLVLDSGCARAR